MKVPTEISSLYDFEDLQSLGRYYNTLKQLKEAEHAFSEALDYGDYFEVEVQTLLGLTKVNLELFMIQDNRNYLKKAKLLLNDLKKAVRSLFTVLGEIDLILGLIEMYNRRFTEANQIFDHVIQFAQKNNYTLLELKGIKQKETLQILTTHSKLQKLAIPSIDDKLKTNQIKDAIDYLSELSRFIGPQTNKKNDK